ncbi:MAG: SAM-dependent methyltransferase, partial [Verrucomicrobia bacterium]
MGNETPLEAFARLTVASLGDGTFVRLALSRPTRPEITAGKILGRGILLKGAPHLSLTFRHPTRDETKNLSLTDCAAWLSEQLAQNYRSALLGTTKADWQFISKADGSARLISHKATTKRAPSRTHDQPRATFLDSTANDWLGGLGVLDRDGKLRAAMADKHRQISHYLEILSHLAKDCGWDKPRADHPPLQLADMGCGKGYLTFGAWHLFHRVWQQPVRVLGVETRADLVATTNRLAKQINADGLEFLEGTIASMKLPRVDALIALHACNTATDDAIRRGIEAGAKLILVAPCCHQELRAQLGRPAPLDAVLSHGLMQERMAHSAMR